jgi:hypothetical protein
MHFVADVIIISGDVIIGTTRLGWLKGSREEVVVLLIVLKYYSRVSPVGYKG